MDSVFDTKPAPYRILHQTSTSEVYYGIIEPSLRRFYVTLLIVDLFIEIASALTKDDIMKDWNWLVKNLFVVLNEMETEEEISNFVICKIHSLVAHINFTNQAANLEEASDPINFQVVSSKFRERFNVPESDRLINYYSCK